MPKLSVAVTMTGVSVFGRIWLTHDAPRRRPLSRRAACDIVLAALDDGLRRARCGHTAPRRDSVMASTSTADAPTSRRLGRQHLAHDGR